MADRIIYLARFKVETATPLGIGAGESGLVNDRLVAKDANRLPYIPGTSLAGVVRHEMERRGNYDKEITELFGYQFDDEGRGSRIAFSSAILVAEDDETVLEGIQQIEHFHDYYSYFRRLPERDHVRITHKGTAKKHGKFEEELVHKGTRFVFEVELDGYADDAEHWASLMRVLHHPTFRVGAGTRKGFGQLDIISCTERIFNLYKTEDLQDYLATDSSLNTPIAGGQTYKSEEQALGDWLTYELHLEAEDFFLFGSGLFQEEVHNAPKTERYFEWTENGPVLSEAKLLVPATSVKGTIAHRVAYHYNDLRERTIENTGIPNLPESTNFDVTAALYGIDLGIPIHEMEYVDDDPEWKRREAAILSVSVEDIVLWNEHEDWLDDIANAEENEGLPVGEENEAIRALFGYAKDSTDEGKAKGARGKVIFSDVYLEPEKEKLKVLNHVAIDRFTGGAIDGALFQEQVAAKRAFSMKLFVEKSAFADDKIQQAFEMTLTDLVEGRLALGGNTTKGHGIFTGEWIPVTPK